MNNCKNAAPLRGSGVLTVRDNITISDWTVGRGFVTIDKVGATHDHVLRSTLFKYL